MNFMQNSTRPEKQRRDSNLSKERITTKKPNCQNNPPSSSTGDYLGGKEKEPRAHLHSPTD